MLSITKAPLVLVLAALACLAGAQDAVEAGPEPATPATAAHQPVPRETSSGNLLSNIYKLANGLGLTRCVPYAIPLISTLPKLPNGLVNNDLVTQALSQTTLPLSDVCDFSVTGSVGPIYTDFMPAWYSWHNAHTSTISEILKKCPSATALVQTVEAYQSCPQISSVKATATVSDGAGNSNGDSDGEAATETGSTTRPGAGATTDAGGVGTGAPEGTSAPSDTPEAPASEATTPRDTGLKAVAAAAAGFVGLIAAL